MIEILAKGANFLLGRSFQKRNIFISSSLGYLERTRNIDQNYFDYVRLATLELISNEINSKKIVGNTAELGVYKGKFARYINQFFPERSLYLFDTFEGFDKRDIATENQKKFSSGDQGFSDTSIESVLRLMPYAHNCIPVKGFFPDSAENINDIFVFVSLDADLYDPIFNGLCFFYPKLAHGGYIFIHDFNNDHYKGARKAVEKFCSDYNINYLPIPDFGGSAVLMK